jgi:hypothetical protein
VLSTYSGKGDGDYNYGRYTNLKLLAGTTGANMLIMVRRPLLASAGSKMRPWMLSKYLPSLEIETGERKKRTSCLRAGQSWLGKMRLAFR